MSIEEINELKKKTYQEYLSHKLDLYFNGTGEEHIADFFNFIFFGMSIDDFHDGCALVKQNGKYYYININGDRINDEEYDGAGDFYDGCALVEQNGKYHYININGKRINDEEYYYVCDFNYGCALVKQNGKYHYINIKGEKISEEYEEYDYAWGFHDGCARVEQNDKYHYININGKRINDEEYDDAWGFHDGCAVVKQKGKYHYININGKRINDEEYYLAKDFNDGCALVEQNGKWHYININGEKINDEEYDGAFDFHDGCALVKQNGKYHYINTKCEKICDEEYDDAWDFYDGCARVLQNGMFFYINTNGEKINDEKYDVARDFSHGVAKVKRKGKWYYINIRGKIFSNEIKARESNDEYANVYTILSNIRKEDVKKSLLGYRYQELNLKYQPVFDYGRYILCQKNEKQYFLYDRYTQKYDEFINISKIGYDSHFVYIKDRHDDVSLYLMQKDCMIDVTYYIAKILLMRKNSIDENVEILGYEEFCDEYQDLFSNEIEKKREAEKKLLEEEKRIKEQQEIDKINNDRINKLNERKQRLIELKSQLEELEKLTAQNLEEQFLLESNIDNIEVKKKDKHKLPDKFIIIDGNHKIINPVYRSLSLQYFDLGLVDLKNVDIRNIDFSYTNIDINPQEVYMKSLEGCTFKGISFSIFKDFNGVNIKGCKFYIDPNDDIPDEYQSTYIGAIYDETTLINDIPMDEYLKSKKRNR